MTEKNTFEDIHNEFRLKYPNKRKEVVRWRPYAYARILLYFEDGNQGVYDYDEGKMFLIDEKWKN